MNEREFSVLEAKKKMMEDPNLSTKPTLVNRDYVVMEFRFSEFSEGDKEKIIQDAEELSQKANKKGANSGKTRPSKVVENDAYAGVLAEFATVYYLNSLDLGTVFRPEVTDISNQIDVLWEFSENDSITIEVRSSFVNNGLDFGLFVIDKSTNQPFFDIIGPYYQKNYKTDYEPVKDFYARVLFEGKKYNVKNRFIEKNEPFYLIGFISGKKLIKRDYHKPLTEKDATNLISGDYYVAPINEIWDIAMFKNVAQKLDAKIKRNLK